jgi:salicylate hydroxylase
VSASRTIVVAGAGIGGLTTALTLAKAGYRVVVAERSERLQEFGAGLQLSPNATRILDELGVSPFLAPSAVAPDAIKVIAARTGRELVEIPLGTKAAFRYGGPYWVVHRADLQNALYRRASEIPDIDLRLGVHVEDAANHANGVTVVCRKGVQRANEACIALVGADGVQSAVRRHVDPRVNAQFTGRIAWRGTVNPAQLPRDFGVNRVQLWLGPNAHMVVYPISAGRLINIVAITQSEWNRAGWSEPGDAMELKSEFDYRHWASSARMLIAAVDDWKRWALFGLTDGGVWNNGRIALVGDAAHAMLPFVAQGACMAIEDAAVLARCIASEPASVPAALNRYAASRRGRVGRVQKTARRTGQIYHLHGPAALARNLGMRILGGPRLLARHDWIYDWQPG